MDKITHNYRYLVAYPRPEGGATCDRKIYYYRVEAERAAKVIDGWIIEVDLTKKDS